MDSEAYSKMIKFLRTKKGMSQKDFADALKVSPSLVSQWENAWRKPSIDELLKMSELFSIPVDTILTGKGIRARTEEIELSKTIKYDFYKYLNKEYDFKEHPELIQKHFEYMEQNPDICKEIPEKLGEWDIVRKLGTLEFFTQGCHPNHQEVALCLQEINGKEYNFHVVAQVSPTWDLRYFKVGKVHIKIDFDKSAPRYCGEVNFDMDEYAKGCGKGHYNPSAEKDWSMTMITNLICRVFYENGIDNKFIITDKKDNQFTIRESETKKAHYFVIAKNDKNKMFWDYPKTEIETDLSLPIEMNKELHVVYSGLSKRI